MDFLKTVTGKIVGGIVSLAVVALAITWWQMPADTRSMLLTGTGRIVGWMLIVGIVPWATFFIVGAVGKLQSNLAGAALVLAYTLAEAVVLGWMFHWHIHGATAGVFFAAASLIAGAYNLFACDWIAEQVE